MFNPTPEQEAVVDAAINTTDNLLINALAGAAKTTTLVMIAQALPRVSILCLAFNKTVQMEMKNRLPTNCASKTLNGIGHQVWSQKLRGSGVTQLEVNGSKTYDILSRLIEDLDDGDKNLVYENLAEIIKAIDSGKTAGWIPDNYPKTNTALMGDEDFFAWLDERPTEVEEFLIREATRISIDMALEGHIDFNDQVLMPTVFFAAFPRYELVMVDETQDLSALNHQMLRKLSKGRLIAVGDPCQAIYGFRGAHEESMQLLKQEFSMRELTLSVSFRCPINVVKAARFRAPHMQWPEWAIQGEVKNWGSWGADDIPDGSAIICRNNAPLFNMAIKLLKNGRYPELIGNDIGRMLIKIMKKLGKGSMPIDEALTALNDWVDMKVAKAKQPGKIYDQRDCMLVFFEQGKTLSQAIAYAEHIFTVSGPIKLMTGHKAKGLEFHNIFFLDPDLLGSEGQDKNLRYVIMTRAQETLNYVSTKNFYDEHESDRDVATA